MTDKREIIILHERLRDSLISDISTFGCMIAACYVGVALNSQALQWIAGLMIVLGIVTRASKGMRQRFTIDQARKRLDQIE